MQIAQILERIFLILICGVVGVFFKLINAIFSMIGHSINQKQSQIDSNKVFGKLDQGIEIYDPKKDNQNAD